MDLLATPILRHGSVTIYREHILPHHHLLGGNMPMDGALVHTAAQARGRYGVGEDLPSLVTGALWEQRAVCTD
jgi:hypothetical protein